MDQPPSRALYVADICTTVTNGMSQRSHQMLLALSEAFDGRLDVLSLGDSPKKVQAWLAQLGVRGTALSGPFAFLARMNTRLWLAFGFVFCNKLRLFKNFPLLFPTPLPQRMAAGYQRIVCYYPWAFLLLALKRQAPKVIADLGDVMADRHARVGQRRWISLYPKDEKSILESDARIIVVSRFDAMEFEIIYGRKADVAPILSPGYENLMALADQPLPRTLGYIGARSHFNELSLRELARPEFLAALRSANVELLIAGRICLSAAPDIIEALKAGGANVIGEVESTRAFFERIGGLINPAGPSSGLKVKSVETLIAGRTLITTEWGTDGVLDDVFGERIVRLDWPLDPLTLARKAIEALDRNAGNQMSSSRLFVACTESALAAVLRG